MIRLLVSAGLAGLTIFTQGCTTMVAGAMAVSTPQEIKRSKFTTRLVSDRPLASVTACMRNSLVTYRDETGKTPYAAIVYREGATHEIMLNNNAQSSWSGARPELLFLIEASASATGGTDSQIWAHQYLLSGGGSQGYLNKAVAVVRPCSEGSMAHKQTTAPVSSARSQDLDSLKKLEQLKDLADRGIISKEDFERKKKEILDSL